MSENPNPHCECDGPGFCTRHKVQKDARLYALCSGRATDKPDCGFRFWCAWEQGRLGAVPQAKPKVSRSDWKCAAVIPSAPNTRKTKRVSRDTTKQNVSDVGDILTERFQALGFKPVKGCSCNAAKTSLNEHTPEEILSDLQHWAAVVQKSARSWKEIKGGLWKVVPTPPVTFFGREVRLTCEESIRRRKE